MKWIDRRGRRICLSGLRHDEYGLLQIRPELVESFVDIGANCGVMSRLALRLFPRAHVYAVEPTPQTYDCLVENLADDRCTTLRAALGNGKEFGRHAARTSVAVLYEPLSTADPVPSYRLPGLLNHFGVNPETAIIKIDAEGAEEWLLDHRTTRAAIRKCVAVVGELHRGERPTMLPFINWGASFSYTHLFSYRPGRKQIMASFSMVRKDAIIPPPWLDLIEELR